MDNTSKDTLLQLLTTYPVKQYRKGEIILFQGEAPRAAYVVQNGVVKAYNISSSGDEKPIGFYGRGSLFPASWVMDSTPSAIYYYEAFTDVVIHSVPKEEYIELLTSNPKLLYVELQNYIADEVGKSMRLNALQHSRASDKLIYTLHYLALSHGKPLTADTIELDLLLTHQDFANLTGLTRETTATELNRLKKTGIIEYGKHTAYKIHMLKLRAALNDQFIADLQIKT